MNDSLNITIDLQTSTDARSFSQDQLIHSIEFGQAKHLINSAIESANTQNDWLPFNNENKVSYDRVHDTISILGTRGSGKSSFLLSLLDQYKPNKNVLVLPIIDPTLIEEKGHIFLVVVSYLKKVIDATLNEDELTPNNSNYILKMSWLERLQALSHGLPSMDGIGGNTLEASWQDPEFIMQKGIKSINSAKELEENFRHLVNVALKIKECSCLMIAFDDIDVNLKKGWQILETIRKYFTSPRIISIVSGDLKLFSLTVRTQQWQNIGKDLLRNEARSNYEHKRFRNLITEMENQYMQKVLKPSRRIELHPLSKRLALNTSSTSIIIKTKNEKVTISKFYNKIFSWYGITNPYQVEVYRTFMLSLPIRAQVQFLSKFKEYSYENSKINLSDINVLDVFSSELMSNNIDIYLISQNSKYVTIASLQFLLRLKELKELYQLQPTTDDNSINSTVMALSLLFSQYSQFNKYLVFDYLIRVGLITNLLDTVPYQSNSETTIGEDDGPTLEDMCRHSGIFQDKVLRDIVGNILAYKRSVLNLEKDAVNPWRGSIRLYSLAVTGKDSRIKMQNRIDYVFKNESAAKRAIAFIPLSLNEYSNKNESIPTYSVFSLIATMSEILKRMPGEVAENIIAELSQIRSYSIPGFIKDSYRRDMQKVHPIDIDESPNGNEIGLLSKAIIKWHNNIDNSNIAVSPHILGKISTRFYYALKNIDKTTQSDNLGQVFQLQILAFLNAVLIEEARENTDFIHRINLNNVNSSERVFINNLKVALEYSTKKFNLLIWLMSCPLLLSYMDTKILAIITPLLPSGSSVSIEGLSIYSLLKNVKIWERPAMRRALANEEQVEDNEI